jgi:hypothetical protein
MEYARRHRGAKWIERLKKKEYDLDRERVA